jgi:uncharacterized protein DUF2695
MDKAARKRLKQQLREQQRSAALGAVPLAIPDLQAMFDALDIQLGRQACDRSRRLTQAWLVRRGCQLEAVFAWLDTHGGFCDCEVLANVRQHFDEITTHSRTPPG